MSKDENKYLLNGDYKRSKWNETERENEVKSHILKWVALATSIPEGIILN